VLHRGPSLADAASRGETQSCACSAEFVQTMMTMRSGSQMSSNVVRAARLAEARSRRDIFVNTNCEWSTEL
jgi:hypothetical protein